jgi:hypothetical protein
MRKLGPVEGIEPSHPAYKAGPLPLRINRREKTPHGKWHDAGNLQTDGDLLSIPKEAVARSPSNAGRSQCQIARCHDGIDRHASARAPKRARSKLIEAMKLVLRTIGPSCHVGGGCGLRRLVAMSGTLPGPTLFGCFQPNTHDARTQLLARSTRPGGGVCEI